MDRRNNARQGDFNFPRGSRFALQDENRVNIQVLYQGLNEIDLFLPGTIIVSQNRIFAINFNRINIIRIRGTHGRHIREELSELLVGDRLIVDNMLFRLIDWENPRPIHRPDSDSENDTISYSSNSDDVSSWEGDRVSDFDSE